MQINLGCKAVIKDSLNFLGSGLDNLVQILKDEGKVNGNIQDLFKHTYSYFNELRKTNNSLKEEDFDLLTRKNVYPYEYMDNLSKCKQRKLPKRKDFYSSLTNESITEEDYKHGQTVFEKFKCKNLGAYTDLYVITDTLLLADVLENLRKTTFKHFELDPVYYTSLPSLVCIYFF